MTNIVKKTLNTDTGVTELRTTQEIFTEIQDLENFKTLLRRCLCDYSIRQHPEFIEILDYNLRSTKSSLRELYIELQQAKAAIVQCVGKVKTGSSSYQYNDQELKAISKYYGA